ncbi:unnamed protein product, partial [marine sediment metagenome]
MTKRCPKCGLSKLLKEFWKNKYTKSGLACYCKDCQKKRVTKWRQANPIKARVKERKKHLMQTFGLTLEDYDQMLGGQNGVCAICKKPEINKRLSIDH